jgi:hypothetical protein
MQMQDMCVVVTILVVTYAGAAANDGNAASQPTEEPGKLATARLAFSENRPRVFARGDGWLLGTVEPDPISTPDENVGRNCTLTLSVIAQDNDVLAFNELRRISLLRAGTPSPEYAIQPADDLIKVAYESQSSATSKMVTGAVKVGQQYSPRLGCEARADQFVVGNNESSMVLAFCPAPLDFVRQMAGDGQTAICGYCPYGLRLLVASAPKMPFYRWVGVPNVYRDAISPRGAWLAADRMVMAWIDPNKGVYESRVIVGVVSRTITGNKQQAWTVAERRTVHTGPTSRIDVLQRGNRVLLGIMEMTGGAPRVVVYEGDENAGGFHVSGAMSLGVEGTPVDFAIDDSGKTVAGIVSTGYRKDYLVFVQPLTLGKYEKLTKEEAAALQKKLEAEWKARKAAEEEAKARQPHDLQERLQQN